MLKMCNMFWLVVKLCSRCIEENVQHFSFSVVLVVSMILFERSSFDWILSPATNEVRLHQRVKLDRFVNIVLTMDYMSLKSKQVTKTHIVYRGKSHFNQCYPR